MKIAAIVVVMGVGVAALGCRARHEPDPPAKVVIAEPASTVEPVVAQDVAAVAEAADTPASCGSSLFGDAIEKPSDPADLLFYVNRWNAIPAAYPISATSIWTPCAATKSPGDARDLVCIPSAYTFKNREALRGVAFEDVLPSGVTTTFDGLPAGFEGKLGFKALIDAARAEAHFDLYVRSGFRAYIMQSATFLGWMAEEIAKGRSREDATNRVRSYSAAAGHSEHQLGTTADLVYRAENGAIYEGWDAEKIAESAPMKWATENAHRFGLVLTYERDRTSVTQYVWEPWHFRYVGFEAANDMRKCGLSTEEFLQSRYHSGPLPPFETGRRGKSAHRLASGKIRVCAATNRATCTNWRERLRDDWQPDFADSARHRGSPQSGMTGAPPSELS